VRVLRPDVERSAVRLPEHNPQAGWRFHHSLAELDKAPDFPKFEFYRRDPGEPPLRAGQEVSGGRSYGPGVLFVQARVSADNLGVFEPREKVSRPPSPPVWKWSASEKHRFRWDHYSESGVAGSQGMERYMAMVTHDPRWETSSSLLLFDALATPVMHASTPPLWEVDIPLEPFYAAAPVHNTPRLKRERTAPEEDRYRATVSVTPDGGRILVWLEPEPDTGKVGLWLFDGQGRLLKMLVFPGRYARGYDRGPIVRSPLGHYWSVMVARPADGETAGAPTKKHLRGRDVIEEGYLLNRDGRVLGRFANRRGQEITLGEPGWPFTRDDTWAFGAYGPKEPGKKIGCYYDLRGLN